MTQNIFQDHKEKFNASGLNVSAYCKKHNISRYAFAYWRKRIPDSSTGNEFIEVKASNNSHKHSAVPIIMRLGSTIIEIPEYFSSQCLTKILNACREANLC